MQIKFLNQINIKNIVINQEQKQEKNSSLFAKFRDSFSSISNIAKISDLDRDEINKKLIKLPHLKKMYPVKHKIFISEFRTISNKNNENIDKIKSVGEMISSQDINNNLCTNCGDCSLFCPTGAIFTSSDKLSIWISSNQCISCGVCNHICKPKAISHSDEFDFSRLYRADELAKFHLETCTECKTPFIQRNSDEVICDRCRDFVRDFSDIFKLARDF